MYNFAKDINQMFEDARNYTSQKKKIREIMEKYGETVLDIENNAPNNEYMEFILAGGKDMLERVKMENVIERLNSPAPQTPIPTAAQNDPNYTVSNESSLNEKEMLDNKDAAEERRKKEAEGMCKRKITAEGTTPYERNNNGFDKDLFMKIMKPVIQKNEGIILHPYVDTADKSTVGPGINIDSNAQGVEWQLLDPKTKELQPLDPNDKEDKAIIDAELAKLEPYKKGNKRSADFFKNKTNLRITETNANALYRDRVNGYIKDINDIITDFNKNLGEKEGYIDPFEQLPENLQIVLIDMVYNLGKTGFNWETKKTREKIYGYPDFWKALARRDIKDMVTECIRNEKDKGFAERNKATQELIRETPEIWIKNRLKK